MFDPQSETERAKYVRAYGEAKYQRNAGRQSYKNENRITYEITKADAHNVWDFGCGNGESALYLAPMGVYTLLTDFMGPDYLSPAVNRLIRDNQATFFHATLWGGELPSTPGDYGICTDVMEHIPRNRVDDVLKTIRARVPTCFFRIAMFPDSETQIQRRGGALHVTVENEDWWRAKLYEHFSRLEGEGVEQDQQRPHKRVYVVTARV